MNDLPIIKKADIVIDSKSKIGEGQFGTVYKAKWRGQTVAVKVLNSNTANLDGFYKEAQIMAKVGNHPNIVRLMGVCLEENNTSIVSQFYGQGSCYKVFVKERREVPWINLLKVAKGAAAGILHLHAENYIHRDIASRNILISDSFEGVVTDFGMSRLQIRDGSQSITYLGPVKWMAPESIRDHIISKATDVYMFGSFLWELVVREIPYQSDDPLIAAMRVISQGCSLDMPEDCDPGYRELMEACLNTEPEKRPTFVDIHRTLEQLFEAAEKTPSATYRPSSQKSSSRGSTELDDSCPVFDLSTLRLDTSPSPFATTTSSRAGSGSLAPHTSTISSVGYVDTATFNQFARATPPPTYTMTTMSTQKPSSGAVDPTSRPQPQPPRGSLSTNNTQTSRDAASNQQAPNEYLLTIPKLSINSNGYIFTTSPLTGGAPKKGDSSPWNLSSSTASAGSASTGSRPGSLRQSISPSTSSSSQSETPPVPKHNVPIKNSTIASSAVEVPKPRKPSLLGDSPSSSAAQISTSAPSPTASPLSNSRPAGNGHYAQKESGARNTIPNSSGSVPTFGPSVTASRNSTGNPAFGTVTLYSTKVVAAEWQGWKPQFSLEHTFRKPPSRSLTSSGPAQLSGAGSHMSQMGSRMQQQQQQQQQQPMQGDQRQQRPVSVSAGSSRSSHSHPPTPMHGAPLAPSPPGHISVGGHGGNMQGPSHGGNMAQKHPLTHSQPSYSVMNNLPYGPQPQQQQQPMGGPGSMGGPSHVHPGQSGPIGFGHSSSAHALGGVPTHHKGASGGGLPSSQGHQMPSGYPSGNTMFGPNPPAPFYPATPIPYHLNHSMANHNMGHGGMSHNQGVMSHSQGSMGHSQGSMSHSGSLAHSQGGNGMGHSQGSMSHSQGSMSHSGNLGHSQGLGHSGSGQLYPSSVPASPTVAPMTASFHGPQQQQQQHAQPQQHAPQQHAPQQGMSPLNPFQPSPSPYTTNMPLPHYMQTSGPTMTYSPSAPSMYGGPSGSMSMPLSPNNLSSSANLSAPSFSSPGAYYAPHLQTTKPSTGPGMAKSPVGGAPNYNKPLPSIPPSAPGGGVYSKPLPAVPGNSSFHHINGAHPQQQAPMTYQYPY